jgi:uncharacterized protein YndB with AHSA1/START domain
MTHRFEVRKEIELEATPEQIWEAIATGPGIDAWFLGSMNEVEPRLGGNVRLDFGDAAGESTVTAWDPPRRFAHESAAAPDGTFHAFEYVIEAREGGRAVVRLVHSGFLADDWEAEYDAVNEGDFMYLHLMTQYLMHFRGRRATVVSVWRLDEPDRERALAIFRGALGLPAAVTEGLPVRVSPVGLGPIHGVVDFVSRGIIGVRTDDALYRFLHTPQNVAFLGHHIYRDDIDPQIAKQAWQAWLDRSFAQSS